MAQKIKRAIDVAASFLALVILLPLFGVIVILLMLTQGMPVFYGETRVGKHGKPFTIYKFRTMKPGANQLSSVATSNDPNITRLGLILKPSRLDELPQLFNVLRGDMSIVGPRPISPKHLANMESTLIETLLTVRPGITSPASVMFLAEDDVLASVPVPEDTYINTILPAKIKIQLDYLQSWSLASDCRIIFATLRNLWSRRAWKRSREMVTRLLNTA